jgi:hypothetical protein
MSPRWGSTPRLTDWLTVSRNVTSTSTYRVEAGSNTSTVTLRVVAGDEKGSLKSETVKYGHESKGPRTRERLCWRGPVTYTKDRLVFSSDRAPQKHDRNCQRVINIWTWAPDGARHQDLLIDWPSVTMWLWLWHPVCSHVEAESNNSIVALRVVRGEEKERLESGTVKYGRESHGTRIREWMRWRELAAIVNDRPIHSSERMFYMDYDRRCSIEKKNSGRESQGVGAKTNWLAVNRQS